MRPATLRIFSLVIPCAAILACDGNSQNKPGLTETPTYVSKVPGTSNGNTLDSFSGQGTREGATAPTTAGGDSGKTATAAPVIPGGRVADVQEADVYRVVDGKLYLLNTYRGFLVYDISDPKKPARLSHLPVYGYPVEMFVENNTVYALLSDALYLTKVGGEMQFQRRNSSQIVTIDISDPANPKLLQAQDLAGQLREGVSRKIENTIYVVSYQPEGYWYYGWGPQTGALPQEEAWVYSFDVSTPSNLKQVGKLKVFEGGSTNTYDEKTGESHGRSSNGVTLSATSNAIMVVQNWYTYDSVPGKAVNTSGTDGGVTYYTCGSYKSDQDSVVSVVDVSDPAGTIQVAATFATQGALTDQFKQTYVFDAQANTGTYLGIFARNIWSGTDCNYTQQTQNTLVSWNIVGDGTAKQLSAIDFGKPNETVRGSYFDPDRKVAFAITARSMDPMYAISFADRSNLKILSSIDGLSGDMDLFRPVEGGQYLLAVGRDIGSACATYVPGKGDAGVASTSQISVSLIDVRDLTNIRLVQRKCLDVAGAGWVSSNVTWNLDQAHKMIGLDTSGPVSVLTVPVSYYLQDSSKSDWYWYRYETAVGILSWDISKYDDKLPPEQQSVITTHGHFVHPNGEVNRSVIYSQGAGKREMLNISDMYLSFANIQNLDSPVLDSVVEVATGDQAVFRFGDYVVVQVALPSNDYSQGGYEFRVKKAGGEIDGSPTVASFIVGQVNQVLRHGNNLILLRPVQRPGRDSAGNATTIYATQGLVYDLSNPIAPKALSTVDFPDDVSPYYAYYRYYCGMGYYGGYYFGYGQSMVSLTDGIAFLATQVDYKTKPVTLDGGTTQLQYVWTYKHNLAFLDLRDPTHPTVSEMALDLPGASGNGAENATLVADSADPSGVYVSYRLQVGSQVDPQTQTTLYSYANYVQRWQRKDGAWTSEGAINIPGALVRSWANASGERIFLSRDDVYTSLQQDGYWQWIDNVTLSLLKQVTVDGKVGALMLDSKSLAGMTPKSIVYDGDRIFVAMSNSPYYYGYYMMVDGPVGMATPGRASGGGIAVDDSMADAVPGTPEPDTSDRITILDASQGKLTPAYDAPTGLTNLDLMGVQQNKLFVNLQGDGILVVDVASASAPKAVSFYRTLGWASGIEFAGSSAYVPAYYYGTYRLDLNAQGNL